MTCDRCPLALTCLYGEVSLDVCICKTCNYAHVNYGHIVFKCANPAQLTAACSAGHRDMYHCFLCAQGSHAMTRSGVPIIKKVYFDLDDNDMHSA